MVIERYGYQSIRTDLIKLSKLVLTRFEEKIHNEKHKNHHEIVILWRLRAGNRFPGQKKMVDSIFDVPEAKVIKNAHVHEIAKIGQAGKTKIQLYQLSGS